MRHRRCRRNLPYLGYPVPCPAAAAGLYLFLIPGDHNKGIVLIGINRGCKLCPPILRDDILQPELCFKFRALVVWNVEDQTRRGASAHGAPHPVASPAFHTHGDVSPIEILFISCVKGITRLAVRINHGRFSVREEWFFWRERLAFFISSRLIKVPALVGIIGIAGPIRRAHIIGQGQVAKHEQCRQEEWDKYFSGCPNYQIIHVSALTSSGISAVGPLS